MSETAGQQEYDDKHLERIKQSLKAGKLETEDLRALESLVERTERATRQLRAAIVE